VRLAANPLNAVLRAQRRFWTLCTVYGAGLAVIAAASAHWVPRAGLEGAAWGFLAGTVVEAALLLGLAAATFPRPQTTRNAAPLAAAEKPLLVGEI
jgi:hypothetical protein